MIGGNNDLKFFKDFLKHKNVLEWSKELSKSIPKLLPEIVKIVDNCKEEMVNINFSIDEEEKAVLDLLKKESPQELDALKAASGLSNKKWDKAIKGLRKHKLANVEKTDDGLFVTLEK